MSKVIQSPLKRFTGSVTIADPLTIPQAQKIDASFVEVKKNPDGSVYLTTYDTERLPVVLACVEKWEIDGIPEGVTFETFPASPRKATHEFIDFIYREILKVYTGDAEIPNE